MMRTSPGVAAYLVALLLPRAAIAEVSDKVASIPEHWLLAFPVAAVLFLATRWRWWLSAPLVVVPVAVTWGSVDLVTEPYLGPALWHEQGWPYFSSLWAADLLIAVGFLLGTVLGWRRRPRTTDASLPNPPLQRT